MPEVDKLSVRHDTIMNFMLANPTVPLGQVAALFNVTQPWLSCIIHSNVFQAKLREKQETVFNVVVLPLAEKMMALAHTGVERLHEKMCVSEDQRFLAETTFGVLDRLGYSPKSRGTAPAGATMVAQQNNYYSVDRETLARARASMQRPAEPEPVDGEFTEGEQDGGSAIPALEQASV